MATNPSLPDEKWRPLFDRAGVEFGYRSLGRHLDMDYTRIRRALIGGGTTTDAIEKIAAGFGVTADTIWRLRGDTERVGYRPFDLPENAHLLTEAERKVIRDMINALLAARGDTHLDTNQR